MSVVGASAVPTPRSWFRPESVDDDARVRLFLLPPAGSGGLLYRAWAGLLPTWAAAQSMTLPGHESRHAEEPYAGWDDLLEAVVEAVANEVDERPFVLFGHSLGALLAYRVAVRLDDEGSPPPALLAVSSWSPVGFAGTGGEQDRMMSESEVVAWARRFGSLPASVYEDPEMLALVVPALRADLAAAAQYVDDGARVEVPIVSYGGRSDPLVCEPGAMSHWAERTPRHMGHTEFPGGHFYIEDHALSVVTDLVRHVARHVTDP